MKSILHYANLTFIVLGLLGTSIYAMYESVIPLLIMLLITLPLATISAGFFENPNNTVNKILDSVFNKIYG